VTSSINDIQICGFTLSPELHHCSITAYEIFNNNDNDNNNNDNSNNGPSSFLSSANLEVYFSLWGNINVLPYYVVNKDE